MPSARRPHKLPVHGTVGRLLGGSWGATGDAADVVLCHGPPQYILDTVGSTLRRVDGESVGCAHMLAKLRAVKPAVVAFGHVHAAQGLKHLIWSKSKAGRAWLAEGKANLKRNMPWPDPPEARARRVIYGDQLADAGAGAQLDGDQLRELQADVRDTLFVNAANLNATTPMVQHGLTVDEYRDADNKVHYRSRLKERKAPLPASFSLRALRPPIVVRVFAKGQRAEVVPLNVTRFPESY